MLPVRILVHDDFDAGVRHRPAEIIISLDCDFDDIAQAVGFLGTHGRDTRATTVFVRRADCDLELGQLVFLQAEQRRIAHGVLAPLIPERDVIFAQRHLLRQFERTRRAAERVQRRLALLHLRAARIVDLKLNRLIRGRGINPIRIAPRDELPIGRLLGPIRGPVGESINLPRRTRLPVLPPGVARAERLLVLEHRTGEQLHAVLITFLQVEYRQPIRIGLFGLLAHVPFIRVPAFAQHHLCIRQRRAADRVAEINHRLLAGTFQHQRRIRHQNQLPRRFATRLAFENVSTGRKFFVEADGGVAGFVVALVLGIARPALQLLASFERDVLHPVAPVVAELHITVQLDGIQREFDLFHVAPVQRVLHLGAGQEEVGHHHVELRIGDLLDGLLRLLPITRLAFLELSDKPPIKFQRAHEVRFRAPVAVLEKHHATFAGNPLGVVEQRVVIPIGFAAELERRLEFILHALALLGVAGATITQRHRQQIVRVRQILFRLRNLQRVFENAHVNEVSEVAVVVIRLDARRLGHAPDDAEVAFARQLDVAGTGPPVERRLVILPRLIPVAVLIPLPVKIAQRLLHLDPDAVAILDALHVAHQLVQLRARLFDLRIVGGLRGGCRAPLRVVESETNPARLVRRDVRHDHRARIQLVRLAEGFVGVKLFGVSLDRFVGLGESLA